MRTITELTLSPQDPRFGLGGPRRKTHRFDALTFMERATARALGRGDYVVRRACCELCRREYRIVDQAITTCPHAGAVCMQRAVDLRGLRVRVVPL